ncbi:MAG: hypothetical protein NZ821_06005 [Gloeomargarita sp. SKYB31]|nr:hypothetical protein [Gloeomargarita sp. SKYB31]
MAVIGGTKLAVEGLATVASWKITWTEDKLSVVASNTKQTVARICGVRDWEGQIVCYGHTPVYLPGDTFEFCGVVDGNRGVKGDCVVAAITLLVDYANVVPLRIVYDIAGKGPLQFTTKEITDTATPTIICPTGLTLSLNNTPLDYVASCMIRATCSLPSYVANTTSGWRCRLTGPLDAMAVLTVWLNSSALPSTSQTHTIQLQVEQNKAWTLQNFYLTAIQEYGASLPIGERGELDQYRLQFQLGGTLADGYIQFPDNRRIPPQE